MNCEFKQLDRHTWHCTVHDCIKVAGTTEPNQCNWNELGEMEDRQCQLISERDEAREQLDEVVAALRGCINAHCDDDRLYCSTCTPARALLSRIEGKA